LEVNISILIGSSENITYSYVSPWILHYLCQNTVVVACMLWCSQ